MKARKSKIGQTIIIVAIIAISLIAVFMYFGRATGKKVAGATAAISDEEGVQAKNAQDDFQIQIEEIFALARRSTEGPKEQATIDFYGFFMGMSYFDAVALARYYKIEGGEYSISAFPGRAVHRLWISKRGVRGILKNGDTLDELAQAAAKRVGGLRYDPEKDEYGRETPDGIVIRMDAKGLTLQKDCVASQNSVATEAAAKEEKELSKKILKGIIENMVGIPGLNLKMGKYEVTQSQWGFVMGDNPSRFKGDDNPVEQVSWNDCNKFIEKLNAMPEVRALGLRFRFPKEEEWKYACCAGGTGAFCRLADGTEMTAETLGKVAWYGENSGATSHPVGQKMSNAFGLYDMLGNVDEWCEDLFEAGDSRRVFTGGAWQGSLCDCPGERRCTAPDEKDSIRGFRLAATQEPIVEIIRNMVTIPGKGFKMGRYEVTQAQWQEVMGENPSCFKKPDSPVENVSWDDCKMFIEKLNARPEVRSAELTFRLPTEAEWAYACRAGGTGGHYHLADGSEMTEDVLGKMAWYGGNSGEATHPVGQKMPNAFGLYDMLGNAWEWCEDSSSVDDSRHLILGRCWCDKWDEGWGVVGYTGDHHRGYNLAQNHWSACGLRLVASPSQK